MIHARGGLSAVSDYTAMHAAILRLDVAICTAAESSTSFPYIRSEIGAVPLGNVATITQLSRQEEVRLVDQHAQDFILFLQSLNELQSSKRASSSSITDLWQSASQVIELSSLDYRAPYLDAVTRRTKSCARLACLCYLSALLLDQNRNAAITDRFAAHLIAQIQARSTHHRLCVDELLFVLFGGSMKAGIESLPDNSHDEHNARVWLTSRLMSVTRRLEEPLWHECTVFLVRVFDARMDDEALEFSSYLERLRNYLITRAE